MRRYVYFYDNSSGKIGSVTNYHNGAMGKMRNCGMRKVKCGMKNAE